MSYYDDDRAPRRHRSTKDRRPREYTEEETYVARGGVDPRDSRQLVRRRNRDESTSSVEEIERDFAPGDGGYVRRKTTIREGVRRRARSADRYDDDYDDRRSDYRGAGKKDSRRYEERHERKSHRRDDYSDSSGSRSPPRRRDSLSEKALAALGLSGAAAALTNRSRSRSRADARSSVSKRSRSRKGRSRSGSRSRSRDKGRDTQQKITQAVKAALAAGAAEAVRARKEPGGWGGAKGRRVLTAAIGAAGVDGLIDRDPNKHGTRHVLESALAGLATNRIVNGPRSRSRGPAGRGRSPERSQSRGGVKDLAAGGILAAAGKKIYDNVRSRSRGRERSNSAASYSSYDSRSPPRKTEKKRSQSISDMARKGMAALGIKEAVGKGDKHKSRRDSDSSDDYHRRDVGQPRSMTAPPDEARAPDPNHYHHEPHHLGDPETDSDSDLGSSTDEEKRTKKAGRKQWLTAGLATVATIHAAHSVYSSMEARNERRDALKSGEISKDEARREKTKARMKDAASIGIAALGIKGALSEWKEVKEQRHEVREEREKVERHRKKRAARRAKMNQAAQDPYSSLYSPSNGQFAGSAPNLSTNGMYGPPTPIPYAPQPQAYHASGPIYHDGNPYAAGPYSPSPVAQPIQPPPPTQQQHQ